MYVYQSLDCGWEGPCSQACVPILSGFEHEHMVPLGFRTSPVGGGVQLKAK